jgi:hypothetical protein
MKLYNALVQEESKIHEHTTQLTIVDSSFFCFSDDAYICGYWLCVAEPSEITHFQRHLSTIKH